MTLLVRPARLVLAVSGGSDSVGLLMTFADHVKALPDRDVDLVVATIDHALRPASAQEALDVGLLCAELGIPHVIRRWEGDKPKSGISAAAREARYRLLMEIADTVGADAIVTGHTADDQAETIAMRASRNASPDNRGLSGMAEAVLVDGRRWLLRPFLSRRGRISAGCSRRRAGAGSTTRAMRTAIMNGCGCARRWHCRPGSQPTGWRGQRLIATGARGQPGQWCRRDRCGRCDGAAGQPFR